MIEPIHRTITVPRAPDDAFRLFTTEMGSWWPLVTHGRADEHEGTKTERLVFEERDGGRIYEALSNGLEADWGVVTSWEPPARVVIDWNPSPDDRPYTELEVTFASTGDGTTRVDLFHRHWERLGDEDGERYREDYDSGWAYVLDGRFGTAAA
jgi:uncharacterized protein YndB with AHSA1/START domain